MDQDAGALLASDGNGPEGGLAETVFQRLLTRIYCAATCTTCCASIADAQAVFLSVEGNLSRNIGRFCGRCNHVMDSSRSPSCARISAEQTISLFTRTVPATARHPGKRSDIMHPKVKRCYLQWLLGVAGPVIATPSEEVRNLLAKELGA